MADEESDPGKIKRVSSYDLDVVLGSKEIKYRKKYLPEPESIADDKLVCTICFASLARDVHNGKTLYEHRHLHVLICKTCYDIYDDGCFSSDEDGDDKYCRWCGQGGRLYHCSSCTCTFCNNCLEHNLKSSALAQAEDDDWKCFVCAPRPIYGARTIFWAARTLNDIGKEKARKKKEKEQKKKKESSLEMSALEELLESSLSEALSDEGPTNKRKFEDDDSDSTLVFTPVKKSKLNGSASVNLNGTTKGPKMQNNSTKEAEISEDEQISDKIQKDIRSDEECASSQSNRDLTQDEGSRELEYESDSLQTEKIEKLKHKINKLIKVEYQTALDELEAETIDHDIKQEHLEQEYGNDDPTNIWNEHHEQLGNKEEELINDEEEEQLANEEEEELVNDEEEQLANEEEHLLNEELQLIDEELQLLDEEQQSCNEEQQSCNEEEEQLQIKAEVNDCQNDKVIDEEDQTNMDIKEEAMSDGGDGDSTILSVTGLALEENRKDQASGDTMNSVDIHIKFEAEDCDNPVIEPPQPSLGPEVSPDLNNESNNEVILEMPDQVGEAAISDKGSSANKEIEENVKAALIWMNDIANDVSELSSLISIRSLQFGEKRVNVENLNTYEDVLVTSNKLKKLFANIHSNFASIEENLESKYKPWKILAGLEPPEEPVESLNLLSNSNATLHNNMEDNLNTEDVEHNTESATPDVSYTKSDCQKTETFADSNENSLKSRQEKMVEDNLREHALTSKERTDLLSNDLLSPETSPGSKEKCISSGKDIINSNDEPSKDLNHDVVEALRQSENNVNDKEKDCSDIVTKEDKNTEIQTKCDNNLSTNRPNEGNISDHSVDIKSNSGNCQLEVNKKVVDVKTSDELMNFNKVATVPKEDDCKMSDDETSEIELTNKRDQKNSVDPKNFEALQQMLYSSSDNESKASVNSDESEDDELEDSDLDILKPAKMLTKTKRTKKKVQKSLQEKAEVVKENDETVSKRAKKMEEELDSEAEIDMLTDLTKLKKKAPFSRKSTIPSSENEVESSDDDDDDDDDDAEDNQKESLRRYIKKNNEIKKRREEERKELFGFLQGNSSSDDELDITRTDLDYIEDQYASSDSDSMSLAAFSQKMNAKWKELDKEQDQMNLQLLLASDSEPGGSSGGDDISLKSDDEKKKKKATKPSNIEEEASKKSDNENADKEEQNENIETDIKDEPDLEYEQFVEGMNKSRTTFKGIGSSSEESGKDVSDSDDDVDGKKGLSGGDVKIKKEPKGSGKSDKSSDSGSSVDLFVDKSNKNVLKKTWRNHRLLRVKLSDTDTSDEERYWKRRLEKEQKKKEEHGDSESSGFEGFAEGLIRPKKSSSPRKKKKKSSDKENKNKTAGDSSSTMELSSTESSGSSIFKKKKRKKESNDSDIITISEDEKKKKKKKKRGEDSSNESNESGDDIIDISQKSTQGESPGKGGRKNIRKVLTKHELAAATKAAAKEEEERKKRIAARQKLFNEIFEIKEAEILEKLVLDFDPETKTELISVDKDLVTKMKPHQAKGVKFMWDSCFESLSQLKTKRGSGCILAHCMGLGKTFQVISLVHTILKHPDTHVKTVLVVCPLSTVLNWYSEFGKWLDDVRGGRDIKIYHLTKYKQTHERARQLTQWQRTGGVMIIGYEMFRILSNEICKKFRLQHKETFRKTLLDPGADLVVCDEGHMLKNESTALSKAMSKIKTLRRIVLTGTPMQNNLKEYHCMVQFVKPNLLGTRREFLNQFVNPITNGQFVDSTETDVKVMKRRAHVLHKMLEGLVQRFDYSVLTPFLPPKHEYVISLRLSEIQVKLYQFYLETFSQMGNKTQVGSKLFTDWQALGRIWTHPLVLKMSTDKAEREREKQPELVGQRTLFDLGFKTGRLRSGKLKMNIETEEISDSGEDIRLEESEEEEESVKESSSSLSLSSTHSSSSSDSDETEAEREKRREARRKKKSDREFKKLEHDKKKMQKQQKKLEKEQNKASKSDENKPENNKDSETDKKLNSNCPDIEEEINLISSEEEEEKKKSENNENNGSTASNNTAPSDESPLENSEQTPKENSEENTSTPVEDANENPVDDNSEMKEENANESKTDNETGEIENNTESKTCDDDSEVQLVNDTKEEKDNNDKNQDKIETVEETAKKKSEVDLDCKGAWWKDIIEPKHLEDINQSAKLIILFAILRECEMIEDKVLVFSQSLFSLDLIEHFLEKVDEATKDNRLDDSLGNNAGIWTKGLDYFRLDGSTSSENRSAWCKAFNREDNPRARLFLISTRAGGLGINLTGANRVVIFDASWNPSHDVQSIFRIYRFGQKKACYVYRFIAHGTMEEKVYERQVAKQSLSSRVVDEQQVHRHFSMNDLSELYRFTPPTDKERPTPVLPKDRLMAELLTQYSDWIERYHEHDSLLENVVEEELNEEERKLAWEDFENDKKRGVMPLPGAANVSNPNTMAYQIDFFKRSLRMKYPNSSEIELNAMLQTLVYQVQMKNNFILQNAQAQANKMGNQQIKFQNKQSNNMTAQQSFNLQRNHLMQKWGQNSQPATQDQSKAGGSGNYMDQMRAQQEANLKRIANQAIMQPLVQNQRRNNVSSVYFQQNQNQMRQQPAQMTRQPPVAHQSSQRRQQPVAVAQNRQQPVQNRLLPVQNRQLNRQNQFMNRSQNSANVNSGQQRPNVNRTPVVPTKLLNNQQVAISRVVPKPAAPAAPAKTQMRQEEMRKRVLQLQQQKQMALQRKMQHNVRTSGPAEDQRKRLEEMKNRYKASRKNLPRSVDLDAEVVEIDDEPSKPSGTS